MTVTGVDQCTPFKMLKFATQARSLPSSVVVPMRYRKLDTEDVMDVNAKVTEFVQQTRAPITVARKYIHENHGDVVKAVNRYNMNMPNQRGQEVKPPTGLQRTVDARPTVGTARAMDIRPTVMTRQCETLDGRLTVGTARQLESLDRPTVVNTRNFDSVDARQTFGSAPVNTAPHPNLMSQRAQTMPRPQNGPQKSQDSYPTLKTQEGYVTKVTIGKPNAGGGVPMTGPQATIITVTQNDMGPDHIPKAPSSPSSTNHKLKRGLSKTSENMMIVEAARSGLLKDIEEWNESKQPHTLDMLDYTFVLPDLSMYSEDFRAFLHKDLIETSTLVSLEQAGRLNWWADLGVCQRLLPLATTGDGNCLLHAASLGMWGFHDRHLNLRSALHSTLQNCVTKGAMWRRWRWHQTQVNSESGLVYSESEWQQEWENMLKLASTKPRTTPGSTASCCHGPATNGFRREPNPRFRHTWAYQSRPGNMMMERQSDEGQDEVFYESLEEFHVFVLAHVLRRPIIVVADTMLKDSDGEALAPIPFGGIYLPLECEPSACHRSPLLLTYDASHFSGLVAMQQESSSPQERSPLVAAIPLVDPELKLLPIHYLVDPSPGVDWKKDTKDTTKFHLNVDEQLDLIKKYLDVTRLPIPGSLTVDDLPIEIRSRSGSVAGSLDSDDSTANPGKDKGKVAKQMQSIKTSFGSIGKSMSKKLKNLGGVSKAMKDMEKKDRKNTVGSVTQSTKRSSVTADMLREKDHILIVKLSMKCPDYHTELITNYLLAAKKRFDKDRELRQLQDREMLQRAELRQRSPSGPPAQCVNNGCEGIGTSRTSYLCEDCYHKEKQQAMDFERRPGQDSVDGGTLPRQDTLTNLGKSKFYTYTDEEHSMAVKQAERAQTNDINRQQLNNTDTLHLARSSFYSPPPHPASTNTQSWSQPAQPRLQQSTVFVDNRLQGGADIRSNPVPANRQGQNKAFDLALDAPYIDAGSPSPKSPVPQPAFKPREGEDDIANRFKSMNLKQEKCRTRDCQFFGNPSTSNFCSSCYREHQNTLAYEAKLTSHR